MALDKQITIYSVDTGNFYSERERRLHNRNAEFRRERRYLKNAIVGVEELMLAVGYSEEDLSALRLRNFDKVNYICGTSDLVREYYRINGLIRHKVRGAVKTKTALTTLLRNKVEQNIVTSGRDHIRELREQDLNDKHYISLFDSSLSRAFGLEKDEFTDNLMVLQVYYFDVFKDMMFYGFLYRGEKYRYLTSSAGQIRKKKAVFIKESAWEEHKKTIMCGLTIEEINRRGGSNVNKYLAYMALSNSATDVWKEFNIDKCIVIPDFETNVFGVYDLIDDEDYSISRKTGEVPIPHTDGAGMMLPKAFGVNQKNKMVRLPWIKGLLGVYDYIQQITEMGYSPVITDIYGKEHNVITEDIQVIFTESQFKMAKFYSDWDDYKQKFKEHGCTAGFCNEEEDRIKNAHINYQMLQTLTDITDAEICTLANLSSDRLRSLCNSEEDIKSVFGVTIYNNNKTPLQQAIEIYPELMNDTYLKDVVRDIKNSLIKLYKSGRLEINGKYTFILPDFYAACEYWFGGIENPDGLLKDGEVFCDLYRTKEKLDCLRSPHLYREHAVRYNVAYNGFPDKRDRVKKWYTTNALYTSTKDMISKILQFDSQKMSNFMET